MATFRLYLENSLHLHETYFLDQSQAHYVRHVLRLKTGDKVHVFNSASGEFEAVLDLLKKDVKIVLHQKLKEPLGTQESVALVFAPLKHGPLDMVIQKGTELGVTDFYPVLTRHTVISKINEERLLSIAIEASEQCERLDVPTIHLLQNLASFLGAFDKNRVLYVCDEKLKGVKSAPQKVENPAFFVGPEGGFHDDERKLFQKLDFIKPIALGNTILKAETAAIACLSARLFWS